MNKYELNNVQIQEILEHSPDGIFTINLESNITYVNPAFCKLLGYSEDELYGSSIINYLGDISIMANCELNVQKYGYCNDQETIFTCKDGSIVHISKNVQALFDKEGNRYSTLVSIRDMSALHKLNKELLEAKYDALTKLPNRTKLLSDIEDIHSPISIILINIDSFKEINTFYGHEIGDQLLLELGAELDLYAKTMGQSLIYKLPVDEYAILVKGAFTKDGIEQFITDLAKYINHKTFTVLDQEISLSITIGVAGCNLNATQSKHNVMAHADMALKLAKKTRKSHLFYDESLLIKEDYEKNLLWIKRLRSAIDTNRVVPFYQPIIDVKTQQIVKYEALVRIIDEDGTIISPYQFLEISKKVKLYHQITTIMIDKVFEQMRHYPELQCSINLSIEDIHDSYMNAYILEKIKYCTYSDRIIFEILESEGIGNYDLIREFILEVKKYGAKVAIDDFGAGYSNFVYITQLDVDYIKIDGSIIRDIDTNVASQVITKTIVDFASQLNIQTVAEYVHNESVSNYLKKLNIDYFQGYFYGEPSPVIKS